VSINFPDNVAPADWCWSCCRSEPIPEGGAFQVCYECGHVYAAEADLLADHNAVLADMGEPPRTDLDQLRYFCAHCIHDF